MQVASDQPGSTFVWNPGNLSGEVNTLTANSTTIYYVYAQNGACVSSLDSFAINVSSACYLTIPNVFTPNGDLSNDFFQLVSHEGIESLSCVIVNRWGNTIRTFNTPDFAWDGTDESGNTVSEGVYFYRIEAVTNAQEILNEHGTVTLVH
jgi:gliding motility-associated-like protein